MIVGNSELGSSLPVDVKCSMIVVAEQQFGNIRAAQDLDIRSAANQILGLQVAADKQEVSVVGLRVHDRSIDDEVSGDYEPLMVSPIRIEFDLTCDDPVFEIQHEIVRNVNVTVMDTNVRTAPVANRETFHMVL